jgi:hypothetical protein
MIDLVIDWANVIVGAVLGAGVTAIPWTIDHSLARRARRADVLAAWATASKQIEILLWTPNVTAGELFKLVAQYPIDHWRKTLGPDDFRLLEDVQQAFHKSERTLFLVQQSYSAERQEDMIRAYTARQDVAAAFSNRSREMWSESYQRVTNVEARAKVRKDFRAHPVKTLRREIRNRRAIRAARPD